MLVDHRRYGWGKTIASAYSVRPKPGAPVSTPLRWDELRKGIEPRDFTMDVVLDRCAKHGNLFARCWRSRGRSRPLRALSRR